MTNIPSILRKDKKLSKIIDNNKLVDDSPEYNVFHALVKSVTGQQLSVKAAASIYQRFLGRYDGVPPEPQELLATGIEELRSLGYSYRKAGYLHNIATYFVDNPEQPWDQWSDDEIIDSLTQIKGVGKWTVQMVLMFTLLRPDVFPIDDLGVQNAMKEIYDLSEDKKEMKLQMVDIAEKWKPHRTVASRYMWASLNNEPC